MKVHIHPRREWREPGKATGTVRCELVLPALELRVDRRFNLGEARDLNGVATFVRRRLPTAEEALIGGSFTVLVEIRAKSFGVRWRRLAKWVAGDELDVHLERAKALWARLPKEKWHDRDEEDLDLAEAVARLRVPASSRRA